VTSVKEGVSAVNLKETQCRSTYHGMYRDMFANGVYANVQGFITEGNTYITYHNVGCATNVRGFSTEGYNALCGMCS